MLRRSTSKFRATSHYHAATTAASRSKAGWWVAGGLLVGGVLRASYDPLSRMAGNNANSNVCYAAEVPIMGGGSGSSGVKTKKTPSQQPPADDGLCSLAHQGKLTHDTLEKLADTLVGGSATGGEVSHLKYDRLRAHINTLGKEGLSPLMVASGLGNTEAVSALLHFGADPSQGCACSSSTYFAHILTSFLKGMSPLDFGIASGNKEVVTLLFAHRPIADTASAPHITDGFQAALDSTDTSNNTALEPYRAFARTYWYDDKNKAAEVIKAIEEGAALQVEMARLRRLRYPLESRLKSRIVGQDNAIQVVSNAVRRKENGWFDSESPLVMMFMGSSGIGKTETAKTVATYLFGESITAGRNGTTVRNSMPSGGSGGPMAQILPPPGSNNKTTASSASTTTSSSSSPDDCFIRIDMSEYQSKHEVSKFIGSPPGYVGHEQGGQLTTKLEKCPNAVVLLDEVEKAHPDVLSIMLQVFDEGRLTSGKGDTIHCKDAIFIMTSNLAQREIADEAERIRAMASSKEVRKREQLIDETAAGKGIQLNPTVANPTPNNTNTVDEGVSSSPPKIPPPIERRDGTTLTHRGTTSMLGVKGSATQIQYTTPVSNTTTLDSSSSSTRSFKTPLSDTFTRTVVHGILRSHFGRDELIGRINEIVYFLPFSEDERRQLATMELLKWAARAKAKNGVELSWGDGAVDRAVRGYNVRYGARSIKYEIDRLLIGAVAKAHEEGAITRGSTVHMDISKGGSGKWGWTGKGAAEEERVVLDIVRCDAANKYEERARSLLGGGATDKPSSSSWRGWFG